MNKPGSLADNDSRAARAVFISYATADRKRALAVCKAIERHGLKCWISARDVAPGENYQEAIVRSLRDARAMVLIFSAAANSSNEIKKELSLASRFQVPVMALRIDEVEPSDAFAYELSTRQWIEATDGWETSIESLVSGITQRSPTEPGATGGEPHPRRRGFSARRPLAMAAALAFLLLVIAGAWWALRPAGASAHSMTVRLAGFESLSADLPATIHDAVDSEIAAAFNADGVIGVSTAPAAAPGTAAAYALGGTIHRVGDSVRVITRLTNERTGAILWSDSIDYAADQVSKIPHKVAVDAGTVIRCGLFGASTYRKPVPDAVLGNYMQYCREYWAFGGSKTLRYAQLVVAAVPDFSWGWSAVGNGFLQAAEMEPDSARADQLRAAGRRAEARAVSLDPGNSEALAHTAYLIDPRDWAKQERLFQRAIAAKPLDCGCEHYGYGLTLENVGRLGAAIEQYRAATDMLALWPDSQRALASALLAVGREDDAAPHFAAAIDLSNDVHLKQRIAVTEGADGGDHAAAIAALRDPKFQLPERTRAALLAGYQALESGNPAAKAGAIHVLLALPEDELRDTRRIATMLGALGAHREALRIAREDPYLFWRRSMRGVLDDPAFPAIATQLGLMRYWKATNTRPDVCSASDAPPFCGMI